MKTKSILITLSALAFIFCACSKPQVNIPSFPGGLSESETVNWMNNIANEFGGMTQVVGVEKYKTHFNIREIEYKKMTIDMFVENAVDGKKTTDHAVITIPLQTVISTANDVYRPEHTDKYMLRLKTMYQDAITYTRGDKTGKLPDFQLPFYEKSAAEQFQKAVIHLKSN